MLTLKIIPTSKVCRLIYLAAALPNLWLCVTGYWSIWNFAAVAVNVTFLTLSLTAKTTKPPETPAEIHNFDDRRPEIHSWSNEGVSRFESMFAFCDLMAENLRLQMDISANLRGKGRE
jgi:hypothetical protein